MTKKITALFLFYAFTFSIIGPMDMASVSSKGAGHVGRNSGGSSSAHYCVIFKGPCKHGETCPKKHLHKPMKMSDSHSSDNHNNNNDNILVVGSSCHSSDGKSNAKIITDRFLVSFTEEFYNFSTFTFLLPNEGLSYVSYIRDIPHRPPAV